MATRNIIPNGDGEGNFGSVIKRWIKGWFVDVYVSGSLTDGTDSVTINDLANPPGGGDMLKATYDPTSVNADAFDMDEMSEGVTNKILTAAERTTIGNQTGTNTGDQDLSGLALKSNVLELDNVSVFTPDADYEPATKKYVDDNSGGGGDMLKATYDPTNVNADAFDMDEMVEGVTNKILTTAERTTISNQSGTNTGDEVDATESIKGIVERATDAEVAAGTDTTRYITSKQLADNLPSGGGDMLKSVYDPTGINGSAFDKANEIGIEQITGTILTPPILNADQDDYEPTGFATTNIIRQDINGDRVITGFAAPSAGVNRILYICNIATGNDHIKFKNNDSSSAAANRLLMRDNAEKQLRENETAAFWYDHTSQRWRPYGRIG